MNTYAVMKVLKIGDIKDMEQMPVATFQTFCDCIRKDPDYNSNDDKTQMDKPKFFGEL